MGVQNQSIYVTLKHPHHQDVLEMTFIVTITSKNNLNISPFFFSDSVRKSVSEASLTSPHTDPPVSAKSSEYSHGKGSMKSQTCQDLGTHANSNVQKNVSETTNNLSTTTANHSSILDITLTPESKVQFLILCFKMV